MPRTSVPIAFVVQAFLAACAAAPPSAIKPEPPPPGPLARNVRPLHYTLALQVDPDQPRFSGTAEIAIELDQPREQLWMHGRGLHITEASADGSPARHAAGLPSSVVFCDAGHLAQMETFFTPRVEKIPSAPRSLQLGLERTRLCIAESNAQRADAESFFRQLAKVGEGSQARPANPRR